MNAQSKIERQNTALWDVLSKTDPAHTKSFSRAGGFKGTAIKPIWIVKMLTDQFGPVGIGWGMGEPVFQVVPCEGETLVYCTVRCWHTQEANGFYGVGGDKVATKRERGPFNDDEAFKKAFTDAVGNAFKFLGVGADVHMGLFDDSKYTQAVNDEFRARDEEAALSREPEARAKLEGPHTSKTALRTAVHNLIAKVREADSQEAIDALLKAAKDTLKQAERDWPALVHGDPKIEEDVGLKGAVAAQRARLDEDNMASRMIADLRQQSTTLALSRWLGANSELIEALDGADARRFQTAVDAHEAALGAEALVNAG